MLDVALGFLRDELSSYIVARTGQTLTEVKLTRVVNDTGGYVIPDPGIGITVINIEEERTVKEHLPKYTYNGSQQVKLEPEIRLNVFILVTPNFSQYTECLKNLSHVITFFQSHSAFSATRYPALDSRIEKLLVELMSLNYDQLNQIWGYVGGKLQPSVVYRVRMVVMQDTEPTAVQPPITTISSTIGSMS